MLIFIAFALYVAFFFHSLTHSVCVCTFNTMRSHCAKIFFYPSWTPACVYTFERIKCFVCFCNKTKRLEYHGATNEYDSIIMWRSMNRTQQQHQQKPWMCNVYETHTHTHLNHHCHGCRHHCKNGLSAICTPVGHSISFWFTCFNVWYAQKQLAIVLFPFRSQFFRVYPVAINVRLKIIKGIVKPINRPIAWYGS